MSRETEFSFADWIDRELEQLRCLRDELQVQASLARAEIHDAWDRLEEDLEGLERRVKKASRAAEEPLRDLEADARRLVHDLREGYRRIRDAL